MKTDKLSACLYITLALDATDSDVQEAHDAIDSFFATDLRPASSGIQMSPQEVAADIAAAPTSYTNVTSGDAGLVTVSGFDASGLPWDGRIHSDPPSKTSKNIWRARRGLDAATKTKVEAELSATVSATGPAANATPPDSPAPPAPPVAAAAPAGLPPLPGPAAIAPNPYGELVKLIASNTNSDSNPTGKLTDDWVKSVLVYFGVADGDLQNLAHNTALAEQVSAYITTALQG